MPKNKPKQSNGSRVRSARFRPIYRQFFWLLVADSVLLIYAGGQPPEDTWLMLSGIGAAYYFLHFLVVLPLVGLFEKTRPLSVGVNEPILSSGR